jgi:hypothetical protein
VAASDRGIRSLKSITGNLALRIASEMDLHEAATRSGSSRSAVLEEVAEVNREGQLE